MEPDSSADLIASFDNPASMDCWDAFIAFIESQADALLGEGAANYRLRLACEELLSNSIRHAQWDEPSSTQTQPHIWLRVLRCSGSSPELVFELDDNGNHFDPQLHKPKEIDSHLPVGERPIGGLGLFLVQQSVDRVEYLWTGDRNRYRLFVKLPPPPS